MRMLSCHLETLFHFFYFFQINYNIKNPKDPKDRFIAFVKPSVSCGAKMLSRRAKNAGSVYIVWPYQRGNHRDPFTQDMLKFIRIQNQTVEQNVREHGRVTLTNSFLMMSYFIFFNLICPTLIVFAALNRNLISKTRQ